MFSCVVRSLIMSTKKADHKAIKNENKRYTNRAHLYKLYTTCIRTVYEHPPRERIARQNIMHSRQRETETKHRTSIEVKEIVLSAMPEDVTPKLSYSLYGILCSLERTQWHCSVNSQKEACSFLAFYVSLTIPEKFKGGLTEKRKREMIKLIRLESYKL